ncbi:MAG: exo-alpha-sialidase [Melioribacter sp.]|nr:exo-alpha-sialidase [Melioribacter sp.]
MKKIFLTYFLIIINLSAQSIPVNYELTPKTLSKTEDAYPSGNTTERILIQDNTIWLGTSRGLSKSADGGNTWTNYYKTEPFGDKSISAIAYRNGVIWAALWSSITVGGSSDGAGEGLVYSTNNGNNWTLIPQPIDKMTDSLIQYGNNIIKAVPTTVTGQNFTYGIGLTKDAVWIVSRAGGLRKSTDMGKTWQRVLLPPDNLNSIKPSDQLNFELRPKAGDKGNNNHIPVSICVVGDDTLYVGTGGGINKSTDGGISWTKMNRTNQTNPISGNHIWKISYNQHDNSVWAATWKAEGQTEFWAISYSNDGGKNWNITLPDSRTMDITFRPISVNSADVIAATQDGLFRSGNNGKTWFASPQIYDDASKIPVNTNHFRAVQNQIVNNETAYIWIGSLANGLIRFEDKKSMWNGSWKVFLKSGEYTVKKESFAFPNPFSPVSRTTRIKYSTEKNSDVTIRIFDFGMNLVRILIQNAPRGISEEQFENWDGRNESGKIVPNGVYFYRIDIGSVEPIFGKIMVLM